MLAFLLRSLSSSRIRALGIVVAVFLSTAVFIFFYALYTHIVSAITYYTLDGVDEKRFTLTAETSFFQLLDREKRGLPEILREKIKNDPDITSYSEFTFIDIPVLGKFDIFTFSLDIDIPTFAVKHSGTGVLDGVGISQSMLRYYNTQFAGSHVMFPVFEDDMIIGRDVSLVFGASKLFSLPENPDATYSTQISHIESDYPGFGVVIPYSVAAEKMAILGKTLTSPYKIVGYMSDRGKRGDISSRYRGYTLLFDQDSIEEKKGIFRTLSQILFFTGGGILIIIYGFIFLLFLGYFREKSDIYSLTHQYKIPGKGRFLLLFTEPLTLIITSLGITLTGFLCTESYILDMFLHFLTSRQIFFPLIPLEFSVLMGIGGINLAVLSFFLILASRKKST